MRFKLEQDVRIAGKVVTTGSIIEVIVPLDLRGQCGGNPRMDGSGMGSGNIGTDNQPHAINLNEIFPDGPIVIEDADRVASARTKRAKLSKFKIEFHTGNSAFADNYEGEVATILKDIIKKVNRGYSDGGIMDSNDNSIGSWKG